MSWQPQSYFCSTSSACPLDAADLSLSSPQAAATAVDGTCSDYQLCNCSSGGQGAAVAVGVESYVL